MVRISVPPAASHANPIIAGVFSRGMKEGLAPIVVETLFAALAAIRDETGVTMILAEQKAHLALSFARDAVVLDRGRIVFRGKSADLRADEALQHRLLAVDRR